MAAVRPSTTWRQQVADQAHEVAVGRLAPANALLRHLYPEELLRETDVALSAFETDLAHARTANSATEPEPSSQEHLVANALTHVVNALNTINASHGQAAYGPDEHAQLRDYLAETLQEHHLDPTLLETYWPSSTPPGNSR